MSCTASIYRTKVNNRNTKTRCKICSKLTIKIIELSHLRKEINQTGENIRQPIIGDAMLSIKSYKKDTNRDESSHSKSFDKNSTFNNGSIDNKNISCESPNSEYNDYKTIYGR